MITFAHNKDNGSTSSSVVTSFSDLYDFIADLDLPASQKGPIRSAIKRVDELVGHGALDLPADPAAIFKRLRNVTPAMAGMSKGSFANMQSRLRTAFRLAAPSLSKPPSRGKLTGAWRELYASLDVPHQRALSRFMHYASHQGWAPSDIEDQHITRFTAYLREDAMVGKWENVRQCTIAGWNRLTLSAGEPALKRVTPPPPKRTPYWIAMSEWPDGLRKDAEELLQTLRHPNIHSGRKVRKVSPKTVEQYRYMITTLVSAAVGRGVPLASLRSLRAALAPDTVIAALNFLADRAEQISTTMVNMMTRVQVMAELCDLPGDERTSLAVILDNVKGEARLVRQPRSMAKKNRQLLDRLEHDQHFSDLIHTLPLCLAEEARANPKRQGAAAQMRTALAMELLLTCSVRRENLVSLELGKSIKRVGKAPDVNWVIEYEGDEVKNSQPLRFLLPEPTVALVEHYLAEWRGRLCAIPNDWLFPNRHGAMLDPRTMAAAIATQAQRVVGVAITPHQFRHISAESFLLENPDKLPLMSEHLGHRDANTTRNYYARSKQKQASRAYQEHVLQVRESASSRVAPRRRKARPQDQPRARREVGS